MAWNPHAGPIFILSTLSVQMSVSRSILIPNGYRSILNVFRT